MIDINADRKNAVTLRNLGEIDKSMRIAIRKGWFSLGVDLKKEANKEILHGIKTGRIYFIRKQRGGRRRKHRSSARGETHANITGKLRRSLSWKVSGWETMDFGYGIAGRHEAPDYDKFVEFEKHLGRTTLKNAINATQRNAESHFSKEMAKVFQQSRLGR